MMNKENLVVDYKQDYKKSWELAVTELFNKDKRIEELQKELKNKPDAKYTLTTADGKEFTIIQSERIDMQQELNNTILDLKQRIDKAIEFTEKNIAIIKECLKQKDYSEIDKQNMKNHLKMFECQLSILRGEK